MIQPQIMETSSWILAAVGVLTALSAFLGWINRQQIAQQSLKSERDMAAMELRLSGQIGAAYVNWQAHNDLAARVDRVEGMCVTCRMSIDQRR